MGLLQAALTCHADKIAVVDEYTQLTYGALREAVDQARMSLAAMPARRIALLAGNGAGWVVADLALHLERTPNVPLPAFFNDAQLLHALHDAGVDALLTDDAQRAARLLPRWAEAGTLHGTGLSIGALNGTYSSVHAIQGENFGTNVFTRRR